MKQDTEDLSKIDKYRYSYNLTIAIINLISWIMKGFGHEWLRELQNNCHVYKVYLIE